MGPKLATSGHILLAMVAIAAVTVLAFAGRVDPTSALLVITGASGISTWGSITAQRVAAQPPELPVMTIPVQPIQPQATPPNNAH